MTHSAPDLEPDTAGPAEVERRRRFWMRRWLTVGEIVGVGALAVAGLGYFDAHRERVATRAERLANEQRQAAAPPLILRGEAVDAGARVRLSPVSSAQVVQNQRYLFPKAVLGHAMEITAAQSQVDRAWIEGGLKHALKPEGESGEGVLPVGVVTTYVEDGQTRTDRSLYGVGYRIIRGGLFGGPKVALQGLSLLRRGVSGELQMAVEAAWARTPPPT